VPRKGHILVVLVIGVSVITIPSVFAVDFVDSSGYTPSWAFGKGIFLDIEFRYSRYF